MVERAAKVMTSATSRSVIVARVLNGLLSCSTCMGIVSMCMGVECGVGMRCVSDVGLKDIQFTHF